MNRSVLKAAPYNPRALSPAARSHLEHSVKRYGLVEPPCWNRRTGNLVGGHQRLSVLDAIEGTQEYSLDVAVVDLDEVDEKHLNVVLNNPSVQGQWDLDLLVELLAEDKIDPSEMGFNAADLEVLFDGREEILERVLPEPELPPAAVKTVEEIEQLQADQKAANAKRKASLEKTRATRDERDDTETFAVLVFPTREERERFVQRCGFNRNERYLDGPQALNKLGLVEPG